MTYFDQNLMRAIIMDHYTNPRNKKLVEDESYKTKHMASESCIDDIYVQSKIENGVIKDLRFDGVACTISTSSTSIMTALLKNKDIKQAKHIIAQYRAMLNELDYDSELLEEANCFCNLSKQANRIKCGLIGVDAISELIEENEVSNDEQ